jgi:hypothetical protein
VQLLDQQRREEARSTKNGREVVENAPGTRQTGPSRNSQLQANDASNFATTDNSKRLSDARLQGRSFLILFSSQARIVTICTLTTDSERLFVG